MASASLAKHEITPWIPIFKGVELAGGEDITTDGRPQKVKAIRVDLWHPDIRLMTTPANGDLPGDTTRQTGLSFMTTYGVQVGINGQYINLATAYPYGDLYGLGMNAGQIVSPAEDLHTLLGVNPGTLLVTQGNAARIQVTLPSTDLTGLWTAVESWAYLLVDGVNTGDPRIISGNVEPRSALGLSQDKRYLILMTIDGRQDGYSEGATSAEESDWLKSFGAYNGINLDGGGSTHMWVAEYGGNIYAVNSPSENRAVSNHLGIYAAPLDTNELSDDTMVYANFENGIEAGFNLSPGYSGSTEGIDETASTAIANFGISFQGAWSQRLILFDDPGLSSGWFVRHLSGSGSRTNNVPMPTAGYVGFWAKTLDTGCLITIAIDNTNNITADRGNWKTLINDGHWHLYEWNLDDDNDWHGWVNGDGIIGTADFTIDSIQIQNSADEDVIIYIDEISHSARVSLKYLFALKGDFEPDGDVDFFDFAQLADKWMSVSHGDDFDKLFDIATPYNNRIDIRDLQKFSEQWLIGD